MGLKKFIENLTISRVEEDGFRRGAGVVDSDNVSDIRVISDGNVNSADDQIIFTDESVDIIGGHVVGEPIDAVDIVFTDGTAEQIRTNNSRGADTNGDSMSVAYVPPAKSVRELGFTTGTSVSNNYGWEIIVVDV